MNSDTPDSAGALPEPTSPEPALGDSASHEPAPAESASAAANPFDPVSELTRGESLPEAPAPPPIGAGLPQPGLWGALGLIVLSLVIQAIGVGIYLASSGIELGDTETMTRRLVVPSTVMTFVSGAILILLMYGADAGRALAIRRIGPAQLAAVVLLVLPMLVVNLSFADWIARFTGMSELRPPHGDDSIDEAAIAPMRPRAGSLVDVAESTYSQLADRSWPVILIFFCLLPAIGEEPFFRGLLGRGLVARYGPLGIALASLLFALQHLTFDHIASTFLLGAVAQLIYLATRSLWGPVVLHVVNNVFAIAPDKCLAEGGYDPTGLTELAGGIPQSLTIAAAVATVLLIGLLFQMQPRWVLPDGSTWNARYLTAEAPPAQLAAAGVRGRSSAGVLFLAVVAYLAFGTTYAWHAFVVPKQEEPAAAAEVGSVGEFRAGPGGGV